MLDHCDITKSFDILTISLSVLHNYFDGPTKLFSDLYLVKFLDTSAKPFFPRSDVNNIDC